MASHVAFLRGINVGGHNVTNDTLRSCFEQLEFEGVSTFLASGNVLFGADDGVDDLEERIAAHLADRLGYAVATFVRTATELTAIVQRDPFPDAPEDGKAHVAFLRAPVDEAEQQAILGIALDIDRVVFDGREMHWFIDSGRMMDSGLGDPAIARLLGDRWTVRTANTVRRIAAKM